MNNAEEATKIAREVKFATIGRAIADYTRNGDDVERLVNEAATLRHIEQEQADKTTRFAGLTRQVGDAVRGGAQLAPLLLQLSELRTKEIG